MSENAYLIPSGLKEGTNLFVRAMSWGNSDNGGAPATSLPSGSHQMVLINESHISSVLSPYNEIMGVNKFNGGFETAGAGGADRFADWDFESAGGTGILERYTTISGVYDGEACVRILTDSSNNNVYLQNTTLLQSGKAYHISAYARGTTTDKKITIGIGPGNFPINAQTITTGWAEYTGTGIATSSTLLVGRGFLSLAAQQELFIDNVVVKEIDTGYAHYDLFENLGQKYYKTQSNTRGYLATFIRPNYISGFNIYERLKYDTFAAGGSGAECASGFLQKLQEQPQNTLLVLSTNDEPSLNSYIFQDELEQNWGASKIEHIAVTGADATLEFGPDGTPKYRSSYVLIASKGNKAIYEDYANSGQGPVGFCGWIKNQPYQTGMWYTETDAYFSGSQTTGYVRDSIDWGNYGTGMSLHAVGFFKTIQKGTYLFRLISDDASYFWLGDYAASGFTTGNATIELGGFHASETGDISLNLEGNTYYPFRIQWGNNTGPGECRIYYKFENGSYSSLLPVYHLDYQTGADYMQDFVSI